MNNALQNVVQANTVAAVKLQRDCCSAELKEQKQCLFSCDSVVLRHTIVVQTLPWYLYVVGLLRFLSDLDSPMTRGG